jgi:hypothetical protein
MPTFGVDNTFGLTVPSGSFAQSSERTQEVETATIKSAIGRVVVAQAKPRSKTTVTLRTKGVASLSTVTVADFTSLTVTSSKYNETNDDFPTSEITGTLFE